MLSRGASSLFPTTGQNSWAEDDCSVFPGQWGAEDAVPPLPFSQASLWGPSSYSADPSDRSLTNLSLQLLVQIRWTLMAPGARAVGGRAWRPP